MVFRYIGMFTLVLLMYSCSTEVHLEGEWTDTPVVYGLLSKQDSAHYIRVEKAFWTNGADAYVLAQVPDSLYYASLQVELQKLSTGQRFPLTRVDGAREGYIRQDGPFAQAPNYLYKIKQDILKLQGGERLGLRIYRRDLPTVVSAETTVLPELVLRETSPANPINMSYDRQITISWTTPASAQLFEVRMQINYRENSIVAPDRFQPKRVEWTIEKELLRTTDAERMDITFLGQSFYTFLAEAIPATPGVRRIFDGIDIVLSAGGQELADVLRISRANTGITASQWIPTYTNISEGRGVFTSRSTAVRQGLQLSGPALDSLRLGKFTRSLNFQ